MNFDFGDDRHTRILMELALGQMLLEHVPDSNMALKELSAVYTVKILNGIMDALDDTALDDFYCIEKIVDILSDYGLRTTRHDW